MAQTEAEGVGLQLRRACQHGVVIQRLAGLKIQPADASTIIKHGVDVQIGFTQRRYIANQQFSENQSWL